jgi:hypothetical protein
MVVGLEKVYETPVKGSRTVVLWVSRHRPLKAQIDELERKLGPVVVYQLSGVIPSAEFVASKAEELGAKYVIPVLPLSFTARLAELAKAKGFEVLVAKMVNVAVAKDSKVAEEIVRERPERRTVATHADGTVRVFEFERFERLLRVELVTEPL